VLAKRTRVRKLDNSKVATEFAEKNCGRIPDVKKKKKKKLATTERRTEYAKLATTSSRGLSTAPNNQPKMSNKRAAHAKITFEQAKQKKKTKADSKSILKLSPAFGGNIVLNAAEGQKPLGALNLTVQEKTIVGNNIAATEVTDVMLMRCSSLFLSPKSNDARDVTYDEKSNAKITIQHNPPLLLNNLGLSDAQILSCTTDMYEMDLQDETITNDDEKINLVGPGVIADDEKTNSVCAVVNADDEKSNTVCAEVNADVEKCNTVSAEVNADDEKTNRVGAEVYADDEQSNAVGAEVDVNENLVDDRLLLHGYLDVVDMTAYTFLGFNFILRVVDPVRRLGFSVVLRSNSLNEYQRGFERLISIMRVIPDTIYFNDTTSFVHDIQHYYSSIKFVKQSHSPLMKVERSLYKRQLRKWIEAYNNNWVRGAVVVQAIVNSMPLGL